MFAIGIACIAALVVLLILLAPSMDERASERTLR